MSANDRQVGGDHYKTSGGKQHWDFFGARYWLGCATKYVTRARFKGKCEEDLQKAIHYLDKTLESSEGRTWHRTSAFDIVKFADDKKLTPAETMVLYLSLNYDNFTMIDEAKQITQYLLDPHEAAYSEPPEAVSPQATISQDEADAAVDRYVRGTMHSKPDFKTGDRVFVRGHKKDGYILRTPSTERGGYDVEFGPRNAIFDVPYNCLTHWRGAVAMKPKLATPGENEVDYSSEPGYINHVGTDIEDEMRQGTPEDSGHYIGLDNEQRD